MHAGPIEEIYKDIEIKVNQAVEERIVKAVQQVDIEVDKEELIKALKYDRDQYQKGYNDALNQIKEEIADLDDADYDFEGYYKAVTDALKVIDKHRGEKV